MTIPEKRKWGELWRPREVTAQAVIFDRVSDGKICGFIVAIMRKWAHNTELPGGKIHERKGQFRFPAPAEFGLYAWNYMEYRCAKKKFDELNASSTGGTS